MIDFLKKTNLSNCRIVENDAVFQILEQIGNTYELCDFERLPIKIRPKSLKINDRRMLDLIDQKRYNNFPIVSYLKK